MFENGFFKWSENCLLIKRTSSGSPCESKVLVQPFKSKITHNIQNRKIGQTIQIENMFKINESSPIKRNMIKPTTRAPASETVEQFHKENLRRINLLTINEEDQFEITNFSEE